MLYCHIELAGYYMICGDHEKTLEHIEKCAETAMTMDTETGGCHSSVLVRNLKTHRNNSLENYGNRPENIRYNQSYRLIHDWFSGEKEIMPMRDKYISPDAFYAPIRKTERFKAVIARLEKYAKAETSGIENEVKHE
jgi:hypothetical protein